jgi:hypothetical protein
MEPNFDGDFKRKNGEIVEDLEHRKKKALAIIGLSVRDEIIPHIAGITDPAIVWQTLKNLFEQWSGARWLHLKTKLTNLRLEEGGSMTKFLTQMKEIINSKYRRDHC